MWYVKNEILNVEFILRFTIRYNIITTLFLFLHSITNLQKFLQLLSNSYNFFYIFKNS